MKPELTNISLKQGELFGREDLLSAVEQALTTTAFTRLNLSGEQGNGKKHFIEEFIGRHPGNYQIIWDVSSNGVTGLRQLAEKLQLSLPTDRSDQERYLLGQWLKQNPSCLFIADVEDLQYLPERLGHVITTSEDLIQDNSYSVEPLSVADAKSLLSNISNVKDQQRDAEDVTKTLGYHPLSLKLAGDFHKRNSKYDVQKISRCI